MNLSFLKKTRWLVVIFCFLSVIQGTIEEVLAEERQVKAVNVQENQTVSSAIILSKIRTKAGEPFSQTVLDQDIKRLYGTGFFNDVKVDLQEEGDGIVVIFLVTEKPGLTEVRFVGNKVFREQKLKEMLHIKEGMALDQQQLTEDLVEIENLYKKKGYAQVKVSHELLKDPETGENQLQVIIEEGPRIRIKAIKFTGNEHYSAKRLFKVVRTRKDTLLTSGFIKSEEIRVDVERLKVFYENEGYLDIQVREGWEERSGGKSMSLIFHIEEGKRYFVGDVSVKGNELYPQSEITQLIKIQSGDSFSRQKIREDLNRLKEYYYD
ncbi:MAG: hypothetical protein HYS56_01390, partial [Candidatus Omnitrophica bacterium]|nr:hypothetical protein [Candidatus Omnitrophota bacterium]